MKTEIPNCAKNCMKKKAPCSEKECRKWIEYEDDLNCCLISIRNNDDDPLTLMQTGERLGLSFVRIRQIEIKAIEKLSKLV